MMVWNYTGTSNLVFPPIFPADMCWYPLGNCWWWYK